MPASADRWHPWRSGRFAHLAVWRPALRVLCYHQINPGGPSRFTVTPAQLDAQLGYLVGAGFNFIHARDLVSGSTLPKSPLLLTFDDGYLDNLEHAQPVLKRHRAKASIFIVTAYAGGRAQWNTDGAPLMSPRQLHELDPDIIELALHSHWHRAFGLLSADEIEDDLQRNLAFFGEHGLTMTPVLAYPYGSRPQPTAAALMARLGIPLAFRLGNRINRLPLANPYEIQRIDVRGDTGNVTFRRKLWIGKLT
jgi:peptidoglycan/xylan/chitin deacetylase (PgdA/CDA1 family)